MNPLSLLRTAIAVALVAMSAVAAAQAKATPESTREETLRADVAKLSTVLMDLKNFERELTLERVTQTTNESLALAVKIERQLIEKTSHDTAADDVVNSLAAVKSADTGVPRGQSVDKAWEKAIDLEKLLGATTVGKVPIADPKPLKPKPPKTPKNPKTIELQKDDDGGSHLLD